MSTRVARVVRGILVAVVSLLVASTAHIAGGGQIGAVGFVLAFAFSTLVAIGLAGRSISRVRITIAVLVSQGLFHLLFGVGASYRPGALRHTPGMIMGDPGASSHLSGGMSISSVPMPDSAWMWVAHAAAAGVTIAALVKGERTFWKLAGWVAHSLTRLFTPTSLAAKRLRLPQAAPDAREPGTRFLITGVRHRGPPRPVASS